MKKYNTSVAPTSGHFARVSRPSICPEDLILCASSRCVPPSLSRISNPDDDKWKDDGWKDDGWEDDGWDNDGHKDGYKYVEDFQDLCVSSDPHFRGIEFFNSKATGETDTCRTVPKT